MGSSLQTRAQTQTPCIESVVLATGPSGKSPDGEELLTAEMKTGTQTLGESLRKKGAGENKGGGQA